MRPTARSLTLGELVDQLGGRLQGRRERRIARVAALESAGEDALAYFASDSHRQAFERSGAGAIVVHPRNARAGRDLVLSENPQLYFVRAVELLHPPVGVVAGVHPSACVHPDARVADSAQIDAGASIEAGASIGARVRVGPGCRIGIGAQIGDDSDLHANVVVYAHCIVGRRAVLNAGCVIGGDGFGGVLDAGRWVKMPHLGRVVLGDDVEVGANTTIDRGALDDTVLEDGVKLDNLIQVGHNVRIGANSTVAACAGIAGSARIGANCTIGGAARVAGHLHLVDGVHVSAATVVTRSIERPGRYTGIFPWSEHGTWLRIAATLRRLRPSTPGRARSRRTAGQEEDDEA